MTGGPVMVHGQQNGIPVWEERNLPLKKERGITIVLGYAPMILPAGIKLGIDVPGHKGCVAKGGPKPP